MNHTAAYLKAAILAIVAFFTPVHEIMKFTIILGVLDFFLGVAAAWKTGEKITSARMAASIVKVAIYQVAIASCFIVETKLISDWPIVKLLTAAIGLRELTSVLENLNRISGRDLLSDLLKTIKETPPKQ